MVTLCYVHIVILNVLWTFVTQSVQWSQNDIPESDNEIKDMAVTTTLADLKSQLKERGVIDYEREVGEFKDELVKLFNTLELYLVSRARQPNSTRGDSTLLLAQSVVEQERSKGNISKELADRFQWGNISNASPSRNAVINDLKQ